MTWFLVEVNRYMYKAMRGIATRDMYSRFCYYWGLKGLTTVISRSKCEWYKILRLSFELNLHATHSVLTLCDLRMIQ